MHLVMINGPCGVGKTEAAVALQALITGSERIRLDDVRKTIPEEQFMDGGKPDAMARMWHANVVGRTLAEAAFGLGKTVIVDAIKYQAEWVEPWESLGHRVGATVLDICLMAPKPVVEARAVTRGYKQGGRLTPEKVSRLYNQVVAFYEERPEAIIINNEHLPSSEVADLVLTTYIQPNLAGSRIE